jgi:hypothetical protein
MCFGVTLSLIINSNEDYERWVDSIDETHFGACGLTSQANDGRE